MNAILKSISFIITTLLVLFAVGCQHKPVEQLPHPIVRPVLSVIAATQVVQGDGYSGTIEPRYQTDFSFRVLGKIIARDVNVGDTIKSGQRIAAIDPEVQKIAVKSAESSLKNAIAQRENSKSNLKRQKSLIEKNATSQADYDLANKAYESAISAVTQAETDLAKAKEELSYTELKSDIDGVVTSILAETDQTVTAGQTVATVANPSLREAVVDISEEVVGTIDPNSEFRIELQISNDVATTGKVREIAPQADAKTRTRRVRIALIESPEGLRLGSTIKAYAIQGSKTDIRLPLSAILDEGGLSFVWIVDQPNNKVIRAEVTVARRTESIAEVSTGIKPGDRIVTAGVHSLKTDQEVKWNPEDVL